MRIYMYNSCRSLLLLCIRAVEGGYEYIHCPKDFTDGHIQDAATCFLNPHCPDKYIYIHTVVSNEEYNSCETQYCHQFHVSPVSSISGHYWQVFWSESDDNNYEKLELIIKARDESAYISNLSIYLLLLRVGIATMTFNLTCLHLTSICISIGSKALCKYM